MAGVRQISSRVSVALGFLLLTACGLSGVWLTHQQRVADQWVRHTYAVEAALAQVQLNTMRAEIGRRGYLLFGTAASRRSYDRASAQLPGAVTTLRTLTADNGRQQKRIALLTQLLRDRITNIETSLALASSGQHGAAVALVGGPDTQMATRRIVGVASAIRDEEARLLTDRLARTQHFENLARLALAMSMICMLLLALLVGRERRARMRELRVAYDTLAQDIILREKAEAQLSLLATHATDAVFRLDREGRCLYASPSVREILGHEPDALVGTRVLRHLHPDDQAHVDATFVALIEPGGPNRSIVTYRAFRPGTKD